MNSGRTIFSQVLDHLPWYEFQKCVTRYRGDYQQKSFSCWDQYLCMSFAQLTYRESLRDIEACLRSMNCKLYLRIPAMPITHSDLMAITIPSDADHRRSEATLGSSYHARVIGIRQSFCY